LKLWLRDFFNQILIFSFLQFDLTTSPIFEILTIQHLFLPFVIILIASAFTTLFLAVSGRLVAHLKILQKQLKSSNYTMDEAKKMIAYHRKITEICSNFNQFFTEVLFVQFVLYVVFICTLGFTIAKATNIGVIFKSVTFLLTNMLTILIFNYTANEINLQSVQLSMSVYESPWYEASLGTRKMLLFLIMRFQVPTKISVPFYEPNLRTFINVRISTLACATIHKINFFFRF
jgi:hypothetical protein